MLRVLHINVVHAAVAVRRKFMLLTLLVIFNGHKLMGRTGKFIVLRYSSGRII